MIDAEKSVLILGAGTFGLSTALELLRKGHKNVTLLDPYEVPSPISAGNDVNKVFQSTVESEFYSTLALEALELWRSDPIFKPAFHEVGIVYGACGDEAAHEIEKRYKVLEKRGADFCKLSTPQDFAKYVGRSSASLDEALESLSLDGRFDDWKGYYQKNKCGWTYAALALENAAKECKRLGAKFLIGRADKVIVDEKNGGKCLGVKLDNGDEVKSEITVICAGANSCKLLDFGGQLLSKCWTVGHIQLTEEEAKALKGMPVVLNLDQGFIFEPDVNNELKFCNEFPGYINIEKDISVPVYKNEIPVEAERQMRKFLKQVFPQYADRPFTVATICWCSDTPDRHFLFCKHPKHEGLVLGTGDSGQGFKYMPNVGKYIAKVVMDEDLESDERFKSWTWRPETALKRDILAKQGRVGGSNVIKDLKEIDSWTDGTK